MIKLKCEEICFIYKKFLTIMIKIKYINKKNKNAISFKNIMRLCILSKVFT